MQHQYCFQAVNKLFKDVRSKEQLFGRLPMVIGGDFAQILSVIQHGTQAFTVAAFIQKSDIWPYLHILFLIQNICLSNNERGISAK